MTREKYELEVVSVFLLPVQSTVSNPYLEYPA